MKGVVFTLDALFALVIATAGIGIILYFVYSTPTAGVIQYSSASSFVSEMATIQLGAATGIPLVEQMVNQSEAYNQSWGQMIKDAYNSGGNAYGPSLGLVAYVVSANTPSAPSTPYTIMSGTITAGYGNVYFAAGNIVYAINASTGGPVWTAPVPYSSFYSTNSPGTHLYSPPVNATAVYDGMLIYQTDANTTALNAYNGSVIWSTQDPYNWAVTTQEPDGDEGTAHLIVYNGRILTGEYDDDPNPDGYPLYALYANNGTLIGPSNTITPSSCYNAQSYVIAGGGQIAVATQPPPCSNPNNFFLLTGLLNKTYNASQVWAAQTPHSAAGSTPVSSYGNVISVGNGGTANLYSLQGTLITSTHLPGGDSSGATSYLGSFVYGSGDGVSLFNLTGNEIWSTTPIPASWGSGLLFNATPIQTSTNVYSMWSNGYIGMMNRSTGIIIQHVRIPYGGNINPYLVLAYGKLYASIGTELIAFGTCQANENASILSALGTMYINNEGSCADVTLNTLESTQNSSFTVNNRSITTKAQFSGQSTSNIIISNASQLALTGPYSVSFWFSSNTALSGVGTSYLFDSAALPGHTLQIVLMGGGSPEITAKIGTGTTWLTQTATQGYNFKQDQWYNVVLTTSDTNYTLYINGNEISATYPSSGTPSLLGSGGYIELASQGNADGFKGSMADLQIYNAQLSPSQAEALYRDGIAGPPISSQEIVDWFPLAGDANGYGVYDAPGFPSSVTFDNTNYNSTQIPNSYSITSQTAPTIVFNYTTGNYKLYNLGLYSWR